MNEDTLNDFLDNSFFIQWVLHPNEQSNQYWENYIVKNPERIGQIHQAREIILTIKKEQPKIGENESEIMLNQLLESIDDEIETIEKRNNFSQFGRYLLSGIGVVILIAWFFFYDKKGEIITHSTGNGETKDVILPDGSEVVLNANSKVEYESEWDTKNRKIRLSGEGLFKVSRTKDLDKFSVLLNDNLVVQVLGTEFIASNRNNGSRVILNEGKVKLFLEEPRLFGLNSIQTHETVLAPGDMIMISQDNREFSKTQIDDPRKLMAFAKRRISFDNSPLSEVDAVLHDVYHYHIEFNDLSLRDKRFSGSAPIDSVEVLIKAVERLYPVKIVKKDPK